MAKFVSIQCDGLGEAIGLTEELNTTGFDAKLMSSLVGSPSVVVRRPWSARPAAFTAQIAASIERWLADSGLEASLVTDGDALRVAVASSGGGDQLAAATAGA